jgi:hypothetical protein
MLLALSMRAFAQTTWDFETGDLRGWTMTGSAFGNRTRRTQPTYGSNIGARRPGEIVNQQGRYWIGTYEDRPTSSAAYGNTQGDAPVGTLTSEDFVIRSHYITFLIGGGNDSRNLRVELLIQSPAFVVDPLRPSAELQYSAAMSATGNNSERMQREVWDVSMYRGQVARIRIVDNASGPWGHINCDDFQFPEETEGDIWITGVEVVQAVQVYPGGGIPLIADKPTVVRVYVRSREDALGPWNRVTARLTVRDIRERGFGERTVSPTMPNPRGEITVTTAGSDRTRLEESFNFLLDRSLAAEGERELDVRISDASGRRESNAANNAFLQRVRFYQNPGFTFYALRYAYTNPSTAAGPFSEFEAHRAWALSALPMSTLEVQLFPGDPVASFEYRAGSGYEECRPWAAGMIDRLFPRGGAWVVVMQPEIDTSYHGAHFTSGAGNHIINMQRKPADPGPTLAHELGHGWGQPHTWVNTAFPRPDGSMGPQVGIRTGASGTFGLQLFEGSAIGDLMSYTHPSWFSPYSYTEILRNMTGGSLTVTPAVRSAQRSPAPGVTSSGTPVIQIASLEHDFGSLVQGIDPSYLYVSGRIRADGTADFDPFEAIASHDDIRSKSSGKTYELVLEDAAGNVLTRYSFDAERVADDEKSAIPFSTYVPFDTATARIVLRREDQLLAKREVSANAPHVTLIGPQPGTLVKGRQSIAWKAEDADGDPLTFSVWYSADSGKTWVPLQIGLTSHTVDVDFDLVPGSDDGVLRVLASDGVNTSEARSTGTFRIGRKRG